ncbi:MAG: DNA polymerase/3'-5' exonuclease PolX [Candidatus Daviesbacteria bacterium]|nr:DNA polymerase/3'-5' exonuclease PolX [Candidatus Daviesbacteria bacterium]
MEVSNAGLAKLLRSVAAAYTIKKVGNIFQIRAYENAADSIEHSTAEIQDLWQENKLDTVPGLGSAIRGYLEELFKTGHVKHFAEVQKGIPEVVFDLLEIPGIGPKTAEEIARLKVDSIDDLKKQIKTGELVKKGFSGKIAQKIMDGIREIGNRNGRMLLPYAFVQADKILEYLKKLKEVEKADSLGSLRRKVATIGDLDFAVSSNESKKVVDWFCKMPGVKVLDQGESKASVVLQSGIQADLLVGAPNSYGALLQHFTGSKNHNIHLRTIAEKKGLSLSEHGIKDGKKIITVKTEEEFYKYLGLDTPEPEIREDMGEIEAATAHKLPNLVEFKDIKGDLHLHSNFPLEPSHGPGVNSIEEIVKTAIGLGYEYVGISDHSPAFTTHTKEQIASLVEKRTKFIQSLKTKTNSARVLNGLEIDILPDGSLSVPNEILKTLDYCIAGVHSGHRGSKEEITKRLLSALENPNVDIISHPSNRLLNERESSEVDWEAVFKVAAKNHKLLEINAFPNRLDLRDDLVRLALKFGVKFIIDTDAHEVSQMSMMPFGVSVARRGWATKEDIVNSWDWKKFANWFTLD